MDKETDEADAQKIQVGKRSAIASLRNSLNLPDENRFEGDTYKYNTTPRGYGIIISNEDFTPKSGYGPRKGDEIDVENMVHLMEYIGLEVFTYKNVDEAEILQSLEKFRNNFSVHPTDLCMVCIMTHGNDDKQIIDINGKPINVETKIIAPFYNSNAKDLIGIPKIFLMQHCRGEDYGLAQTLVTLNFGSAPPGSPRPAVAKRSITVPAVSDIIIVNSTIPGYVANRNTVRGTWLVQCLVKVVLENAGEGVDVREMLEMVSKEMIQMTSLDKTRMQTIGIEYRAFHKKLYLTPVQDKERTNSIIKKLKNVMDYFTTIKS